MLNSKIMRTKMKLLFLIYEDFKNILVPEDHGKQYPKESYPNRYQKPIAPTYGYKLECAEDKFSKPFKTCLTKDAVYNFVNNMIKEIKYCTDVMKKQFNKEPVTTKEDENFKNPTKYWICDNDYVDNDAKVMDHCHVTRKYRGSAHRNCNIAKLLSYFKN